LILLLFRLIAYRRQRRFSLLPDHDIVTALTIAAQEYK
jgi:hypothetical protein